MNANLYEFLIIGYAESDFEAECWPCVIVVCPAGRFGLDSRLYTLGHCKGVWNIPPGSSTSIKGLLEDLRTNRAGLEHYRNGFYETLKNLSIGPLRTIIRRTCDPVVLDQAIETELQDVSEFSWKTSFVEVVS